jgi:L-histidine N-alpha-methyltransferase
MAGQGGALIIGEDLLKDPQRLQAAYDDALGVTAAFNRSVLDRVNRLAGTDFNLADWQHVTFSTPRSNACRCTCGHAARWCRCVGRAARACSR